MTSNYLKMTLSDLKVTSKDDDKSVSKKMKPKNYSKGGNPDDVKHSNWNRSFRTNRALSSN